MSKDLEIRMRIDRSQAEDAVKQQAADLKKLEHPLDSVLKNMQAIARETGRVGRESKEATSSLSSMGKVGSDSLKGISTTSVAAGLGLTKILDVAREISDKFREAQVRYRKLAGDFLGARDQLRELANQQGVPLTDKFVVENQQFNRQARLTDAEGLAYRTEYLNSGAQYKDSRLNAKQFGLLEEKGAQLASMYKLDPSVAGDFFGNVSGFKDWQKLYGDKASDMAAATGNSVMQILQKGRGNTSQNVAQLSLVTSALLTDNALTGVMTDPNEAAAAVSIAAQRNPRESGTATLAALRGLRDFGGDADPLLREAKIDSNTGFIKSIEQLQPIVYDKAKTLGVKPYDVMKTYFKDELTRNSLLNFMEEGVVKGGFKNRLDFGKQFNTPESMNKMLGEFLGTETAANRETDAASGQTKLEIGKQQATLEVLRKQAEDSLRKRGGIDTGASDAVDTFASWTPKYWFRGADPRLERIDQEAANLLKNRMPAPLQQGLDASFPHLAFSDAQRTGLLQMNIDAAKNAGVDVLADALKENTAVVKKNNDLLAKQGGGQTVPPALLINAAMQARR